MTFRSFRMAIAVLPPILAACSGQQSQPAQQTISGDAIAIGFAGPLSGDLRLFGAEAKRGVQLAVDDLNAKGGVLGRPLVLVAKDDQCEPERGAPVARELVAQKVALVVGHFCSGASIRAAQIYKENVIPQITPSSTNPVLTSLEIKTFFRTTGRDDKAGAFAGAWLAKTYAGKSVAVVNDSSPYGLGVAGEARRAMESAGFAPTLVDAYVQGQTDFSKLIARLKDAKADAVYVGGFHDQVGLLVKQARAQGFSGAFLGGDPLNTLEFWKVAGRAGEGLRFTDGAPAFDLPAATNVATRIGATEKRPWTYAFNAYAAVEAWAAAANAAGSIDGGPVADALHTMTIPTVLGELSWDEAGDLDHPRYAWFIWHNGDFARER